MDLDALRALCLAHADVTEQVQWGADLVFKIGGKMFVVAGVPLEEHGFSLKVDDARFDELVARPGVRPAPYLARARWVKVDREHDLTRDELVALIADAYRIVAAKLPKSKRPGAKPAAKRPKKKPAAAQKKTGRSASSKKTAAKPKRTTRKR